MAIGGTLLIVIQLHSVAVATPPPHHAEPSHLRRLADAWAVTGSCNSDALVGRCGAIFAVSGENSKAKTAVAVAGGGRSSAENRTDYNAATLFEIGSVTKVMTAVLLYTMVNEGQVSLKATVGSFAPSYFNNSVVGSVTLHELVAHLSGLPKLPSNLHGTPCNSYTNYTAEDLWGFLATLPSLPGRGDFLYSNLGFGLLGYILSKRAGISFEELLRRKVFMPIGMNSSTISLSADDWRIRVAPGHFSNGSVTERRTPYGVLQGMGAVHSSIEDLSTFVDLSAFATAGTPPPPGIDNALWRAFAAVMLPVAPDNFPAHRGEVASGWQFYASADAGVRGIRNRVAWKSGGTQGYSAFVVVDQGSGRWAAALSGCGGCGHRAIDQAVRQLVDESHAEPVPRTASARAMHPGCEKCAFQGNPRVMACQLGANVGFSGMRSMPSRSDDTESLHQYTGLYQLPRLSGKSRQPVRNHTTAVQVKACNTTAGYEVLFFDLGGGSHSTLVRTREPTGAMPLAFSVDRSSDTICLRTNGCGPLEQINRNYGRRGVYFTANNRTDGRAGTLVLHIDGWDYFLRRI